MWSKKEWVIFLTGASFFHALSHIIIQFSGTLPMHVFFVNLTSQLNIIISIVNILVTLALLRWSTTLK